MIKKSWYDSMKSFAARHLQFENSWPYMTHEWIFVYLCGVANALHTIVSSGVPYPTIASKKHRPPGSWPIWSNRFSHLWEGSFLSWQNWHIEARYVLVQYGTHVCNGLWWQRYFWTQGFAVKYKKSKWIWVESAWNAQWNSSSLTPIQQFHSTMGTWWPMMTYQRAICPNMIDIFWTPLLPSHWKLHTVQDDRRGALVQRSESGRINMSRSSHAKQGDNECRNVYNGFLEHMRPNCSFRIVIPSSETCLNIIY